MVILLAIAYYLQAHGAYAQLANLDQSDKSYRDLGHCRSIWDIVWSCLATIFSCTWVTIHLNIPEQGRGWLWKFGRRVVAFVITLMVPEFIIVQAWSQRASAKKIASDHKDNHWTLAHGFFVNMGGFVVQNEARKYILEPDEIDFYLGNGQISVTKEQIQDRSKGDSLTKGFVVLQTAWFILQLLARAIQHLPITELEIVTLAFAILSGITYALWWNKPLDVECPIDLVQHTPAAKVEAVANGNMAGRSTDEDCADGGAPRARLIDQEQETCRRVSSIGCLSSGTHDKNGPASNYVFVATGIIFGGAHCIAWVSHFPTPAEKLMWQISCIVTIVAPVMAAVHKSMQPTGGMPGVADLVTLICVMLLYPIARLLLLIPAFTTLRSLPPDAYTTVHWTTFVPHI